MARDLRHEAYLPPELLPYRVHLNQLNLPLIRQYGNNPRNVQILYDGLQGILDELIPVA